MYDQNLMENLMYDQNLMENLMHVQNLNQLPRSNLMCDQNLN
jgi:hypothetical protein